MKIEINIHMVGSAAQKLKADAEIAQVLPSNEYWWALRPEDPLLFRALDIASTGPGIAFAVVVELSKPETATVEWFEPIPSAYVETEKTFDEIGRLIKGTKPKILGGAKLPSRVFDQLQMSSMPPIWGSRVACLGEGVAEFVVTDEIAQLLSNSGLTGWRLSPVIINGNPHPTASLLSSEVFVGPCDDRNIRVIDDVDGNVMWASGLKVFPQSSFPATPKDFMRTSDPMDLNAFSSWLWSKKVRDCFVANKIKGVRRWRPVLISGTPLQTVFWSAIAPFVEQVRKNPRHSLG